MHYEFLPTERVYHGAGSLEKLKEEAGSRERAFLVTGRTLREETDVVGCTEDLLDEGHAGTFSGMGQHTPASAVREAAGLARGCDLLVSLGGGSVIDGTKAVARELGYPHHVSIPTTLSGAEWAHRVGVTDEEAGRKSGFQDPRAVPPTVILDPEVTLPTPQRLWLSTGIRALDHGIEGFLSSGGHPVVDTLALEGISRLVELLPRSKENPNDFEIRLQLQLAAWMAYFAPLNTPMGLSHALGRRLGASYGIPHGITSCLTLAPTLEVVGKETPSERWERLSEVLGGEAAESVASLVEGLGLESRLRDFGVPEGDVWELASEFGEREGEALQILRRAY